MNIAKYISHIAQMGADRWAGLLTWLIVSATSVYFTHRQGLLPWSDITTYVTCLALIGFIICFSLATRQKPFKHEPHTRYGLIFLQLACIYFTFFFIPHNYVAILLVIWAAQLPYFMSLLGAVILMAVLSTIFGVIYHVHWQQSGAWLSAVLFWTFEIFSIVMMMTQLKEQQAREREEAINRELRATQALLTEASKQSERTRIARNIHDLVGHHLTALTIQLQVAERKSEGEVKTLIERSQQVAKLLLADVREAVNDIRSTAAIDVKSALLALQLSSQDKQVVFNISDDLTVTDVATAETLLLIVKEAITNFFRHSNGNTLTIELSSNEDIEMRIADSGTIKQSLRPGNGLRGMVERVTELKGQLRIHDQPTLTITAILPKELAL
jgi:signal transduction histidine kinase